MDADFLCTYFFFVCFWLTVTAMKTNRGTKKWVLRGDEVEKELYLGGTKQLVMYQKKRPCLLIRFQGARMADMTFLLSLAI